MPTVSEHRMEHEANVIGAAIESLPATPAAGSSPASFDTTATPSQPLPEPGLASGFGVKPSSENSQNSAVESPGTAEHSVSVKAPVTETATAAPIVETAPVKPAAQNDDDEAESREQPKEEPKKEEPKKEEGPKMVICMNPADPRFGKLVPAADLEPQKPEPKKEEGPKMVICMNPSDPRFGKKIPVEEPKPAPAPVEEKWVICMNPSDPNFGKKVKVEPERPKPTPLATTSGGGGGGGGGGAVTDPPFMSVPTGDPVELPLHSQLITTSCPGEKIRRLANFMGSADHATAVSSVQSPLELGATASTSTTPATGGFLATVGKTKPVLDETKFPPPTYAASPYLVWSLFPPAEVQLTVTQQAFRFFLSLWPVMLCQCIILNYTTMRMPDPKTQDTLPDLLLELIPKMPELERGTDLAVWLLNFSNMFMMFKIWQIATGRCAPRIPTEALGIVSRLNLHVCLWIRYWSTFALLIAIRCFVVIMTVLPATDNHCKTKPVIESVLKNTILALVSSGGAHVHCGDLLFSGHTVSITLSLCTMWAYGPLVHPIFRFMAVTVPAAAFYCILASRSHYTDDIIIALLLTAFVYWLNAHDHKTGAPLPMQVFINNPLRLARAAWRNWNVAYDTTLKGEGEVKSSATVLQLEADGARFEMRSRVPLGTPGQVGLDTEAGRQPAVLAGMAARGNPMVVPSPRMQVSGLRAARESGEEADHTAIAIEKDRSSLRVQY